MIAQHRFGIALILFLSFGILLFLPGCQTGVPEGQQLAGDVHEPSPTDPAAIDNAPVTPYITSSSLQVSGQPSGKSLSMLDFVDEKTGFGAGAGVGAGIAGEPNTLMKTTDGGKTWSAVHSFDSNVKLQAISFLDERSGWALLGSQGSLSVVRTGDGGRTWTTATQRLPNQDTLSGNPLFYFFDLRNGLVADSNKQGLLQMRTEDYGATWQTPARIPLPVSPDGLLTYIFPKEGWYVPRNVSGKPIEIYRMTDGSNWYPTGKIEKSGKDLDQIPAALAFTSRKRGVLLTESPAAASGTSAWHLWETVDSGKTWIDHPFQAGVQISDTNVLMTFTDSNHGWITTSSGILGTEDGGNNWTWLDGRVDNPS